MTAVFLANFISRQFLGPLLPAIEAELGFNHAQTGLLLFMAGIASFVSQLAAGPLAAWLDYHKVILISFFGNALGPGGHGYEHQLFHPCAGRLLQVILGGLYISCALSLITMITQRPHWGKAMGIHESRPTSA